MEYIKSVRDNEKILFLEVFDENDEKKDIDTVLKNNNIKFGTFASVKNKCDIFLEDFEIVFVISDFSNIKNISYVKKISTLLKNKEMIICPLVSDTDLEAIRLLRENCNVIVLNNRELCYFELVNNLYEDLDKILYGKLNSNLTVSDLNIALGACSLTYVGIGLGKGDKPCEMAFKNAVDNTLYDVDEINSKYLIILIQSKKVSMNTLSQMYNKLSTVYDDSAEIYSGVYLDENMDDEARVTIILD
ncbi:MAG: hypothetical protein ACK5LV_09495 [Lachnospirales bacterium]